MAGTPRKPWATLAHRTVRRLRLEGPIVRWAHRHRSFTRLLPQPSDYPVDDAVLVERDGVCFRVNRSDYMQWSVFADLPDLSWRSAVETLAPNSLVVDIGANCGAFCLKVAHAVWARHLEGALVVAFEPNPAVFERLRANLALNPELTPVVEVVPVALGHREGTAPFAFELSNTGAGCITNAEEGSLTVPLTTLDRFLESRPGRVSFVKIDVEGFEPWVLEGARALVSRDRPTLYVEVTDAWYRRTGTSALELLSSLDSWGYRLFVDREDHFEPLPSDGPARRALVAGQHQLNVLGRAFPMAS